MRIRGAMTVLSYVSLPILGLALGIAVSGAISDARADTIVLKKGRRITVNIAKETTDRVTGETDAGEISLPKSMVERVEHGPAGFPTSANRTSTSIGPSTNEAASSIGLAAPATQS